MDIVCGSTRGLICCTLDFCSYLGANRVGKYTELLDTGILLLYFGQCLHLKQTEWVNILNKQRVRVDY